MNNLYMYFTKIGENSNNLKLQNHYTRYCLGQLAWLDPRLGREL